MSASDSTSIDPERNLHRGILLSMHRMSQGGADRVAVILANGFASAGIPTGFVLLRDDGEAERLLVRMLHPDVTLMSAGKPMGSRHLELARGLRYLVRQIKRLAPSLVLASSNNMGLVTGLASMFARNRDIHYVMKVTNPVVRPRDKGLLREGYRHLLYRFIFSKYDRILTLSESECARLTTKYPALSARFRTVANPYVTPSMLSLSPRTCVSETPRILCLARMMPQKRLDILLRAFERVSRKDCKLTILGEGPERPRLELLASRLGISGRVDMPGFRDDVIPWLRSADLFVLSSDYEGWPAVVLEALACEVPVVTTDCFDGARALLQGAMDCDVVPRANPAALAIAIDQSLARRSTAAGLRKIAEPYSFDAAIREHIHALAPFIDSRP